LGLAKYQGHFVQDKPTSLKEFKGNLRDSQNDDGTISGYNFGWLAADDRKFSDVLSGWIGRYKNADEFIKNIGLSGEINKNDLSDLIAVTKIPSKELTNYLSVKVPSDVCSRKKLIYRGKTALKPDIEQVTISDKAITQERSKTIKEIAVSKNFSKEDGGFIEWLTENINDVATRYKRPVDVEKSMVGIAAVLDISLNQLKGVDKIPPDIIQEKAEKLAGLFLHGENDFDAAVAEATNAWSGIKIENHAPAYSRIIRYLRHSVGMTQSEFAESSGVLKINILNLERSTTIEKDATNAKIFKNFNLTEEDKKIISDSYKEYKDIVIQKFHKQSAPIIKHFSEYGLTKESYLKAALLQPHIFYQKPEKIIYNIETVQKHFENNGVTLEGYLKAVHNQPQLFLQKPETIISNIETVSNRFKGRGFNLDDYLKRVLSSPRLFSQNPEPIIEHIELIIDAYQKELLGFYPKGAKPRGWKPKKPDPNDFSPVFHYITHSSSMTNSTDDLKSRFLTSALDKYTTGETPSTKNLTSTKPEVMEKLLGYLNQDDDGVETPASFVRAKLLKSKKPVEAKKPEDVKWVKRVKTPPSQENIFPSP
jgi:transcriptional regulator with XRE-family HTH domain